MTIFMKIMAVIGILFCVGIACIWLAILWSYFVERLDWFINGAARNFRDECSSHYTLLSQRVELLSQRVRALEDAAREAKPVAAESAGSTT